MSFPSERLHRHCSHPERQASITSLTGGGPPLHPSNPNSDSGATSLLQRLKRVTSFGGGTASDAPLNTSHGGVQSNQGVGNVTVDTKTVPLLSHHTSLHSNNPYLRIDQSVTNTSNADFVITQAVIAEPRRNNAATVSGGGSASLANSSSHKNTTHHNMHKNSGSKRSDLLENENQNN